MVFTSLYLHLSLFVYSESISISSFFQPKRLSISKSVVSHFTRCSLWFLVGTEHQGLCEESFRGVLVHSPVCCTWQRRGINHKTDCG